MNTGYDFIPRYRYITGISLGKETVITLSQDHDFTDGEIVSFRVSVPYGTVQLNERSARVLSHDSTTITVELSSIGFEPYIYPVSGKNTPPIVVPSASGIYPDTFPFARTTLFDVFDNVRTI